MGNKFVGYEYQDITVKNGMESIYIDGYENFGWQLEGEGTSYNKHNASTIRFKRDRKIENKNELIREQRAFDADVKELIHLENSKYIVASAIAYIIGVVGTAFMAGSVFAFTGGMVLLSVILAIPALVCWVAPYLLYKYLVNRKTQKVTPFIDKKYEEIYGVCKKANSLLTTNMQLGGV